MRLIRQLALCSAVLGLALAGVAGSTVSASAESTAGPVSPASAGPHSYAFTVATGSGTQSTGTLAWDNTTYALSLTAATGTLAAGTCVTVYFDWRSQGHHDARAVRDCRSNDTYGYSFPDSNTSNILGGPSRMGVCYGTDDTRGTCTYYSLVGQYYIQMDWTPWPQPTWTYPCVVSWTRKASDGTVGTFIDAHSQRRLLQGTTC